MADYCIRNWNEQCCNCRASCSNYTESDEEAEEREIAMEYRQEEEAAMASQ